MRVTHVQRMTLAAHSRRKLDEAGNPIIGKRYWLRLDLEEKKPITLAYVPPPRAVLVSNHRAG